MNKTKVKSFSAREILDSRGNPTLEVSCVLEGGYEGVASVPSGASVGAHEALELRDKDDSRYNGLGVLKAVENVKGKISKYLAGKELDQESLDMALIDIDGSLNKSNLGANAILGCSLAFARAKSLQENLELYEYFGNIFGNKNFRLPQPMFNIINGGKHASSGLNIQEFMIGPIQVEPFKEKIRTGSEIVHTLKKILIDKGYDTGVGDEGGFAPKLHLDQEAIDLIREAIIKAGYSLDKIRIGIDVAATSFYKDGKYILKSDGGSKELYKEEVISLYQGLIEKYNLISIEDGLYEEDFEGFSNMVEKFGNKVLIIGDDLLVTNIERMKEALLHRSVNCALIKPNQIGTLTETMQAVKFAKENGWKTFASHRSGETLDTSIADLAVGFGCDFIKAGSLIREERVAKYNRLMAIAEKLGYGY